MDLPSAAKRYEEGRQFWAREIALILNKSIYHTRCTMLHLFSDSRRLMTTEAVMAELATTRALHRRSSAGISKHLKDLATAGLLKRTLVVKSYVYEITELGSMVLAYCPGDPDVDGRKTPITEEDEGKKKACNDPDLEAKNTPVTAEVDERKRRGRPRKTPRENLSTA